MTEKKYYVKKSENQKEYLILDKKDNHCVCVLNIEQINQEIKDWIKDFEKKIQKNEKHMNRFWIDKDGRTIIDSKDDKYCECVDRHEAIRFCIKLNTLYNEKEYWRRKYLIK